jgi:predicted mannosyl-3-phosphoglycerate phosphatase (HAD superfamily)
MNQKYKSESLLELLVKTLKEQPLSPLISPSPKIEMMLDSDNVKSLLNNLKQFKSLHYTLVDRNKNIIFEIGGKETKKILHRKMNAIQNQREAVETLLKRNQEDAVAEISCRNHLYHFSVGLYHEGQLLGALVVGNFIFSDGKPDKELYEEWAAINGFEVDLLTDSTNNIPVLDKDDLASMKLFHQTLVHLMADREIARLIKEQTQATLRQQTELLKILSGQVSWLTEQLPGDSLICDHQWKILMVSAKQPELFRYPIKTWEQKNLKEFVTHDTFTWLESYSRNSLSVEQPDQYLEDGLITSEWLTKDGAMVLGRIRITHILSGNKSVGFFVYLKQAKSNG